MEDWAKLAEARVRSILAKCGISDSVDDSRQYDNPVRDCLALPPFFFSILSLSILLMSVSGRVFMISALYLYWLSISSVC